MAGSGQISEHRHQSKAKSQHPMTQIATRSLFENQEVRVWEMDVAPGDTFGLHHHTNDYVLYITSGANLKVDDKDAGPYDFIAHDRSVYYIKAGGTESFRNVSPTPFREALIEIKRKPRPHQDRAGFTSCDALVGAPDRPGSICVMENDRMRISRPRCRRARPSACSAASATPRCSWFNRARSRWSSVRRPARSGSRKRRATPRTCAGSRAVSNATW